MESCSYIQNCLIQWSIGTARHMCITELTQNRCKRICDRCEEIQVSNHFATQIVCWTDDLAVPPFCFFFLLPFILGIYYFRGSQSAHQHRRQLVSKHSSSATPTSTRSDDVQATHTCVQQPEDDRRCCSSDPQAIMDPSHSIRRPKYEAALC